jgi:hypothetical protein
MSKLQALITEAIEFWFPEQRILTDYRPSWLFGMELDVFLPDIKLAIEVQGRQHYLMTPKLHTDIAEFRAQRARDVSKRRIARQRGISVFCIRYFDGIYKKFRRAFPGRKFRTLPKELRARIRLYRKQRHVASQKWIAYKVKGKKLIPVNRVSADALKKGQDFEL